MSLLFEPEAERQLMTGIFLSLAGLALFPFLAAQLTSFIGWSHQAVGNAETSFASALKIMRGFFAYVSVAFAALGIARLSLLASVKFGLITSPWGAA